MELRELVEDYHEHFVGKSCRVTTNYKEFSQMKVVFQATDLHHLFELHKLTSDFAGKTLSKIEDGLFILDSFKDSPKFREVLERIELYPFIEEVFIRNTTDYCIVRKDLSRNTMNLDLVFFDGDSRNVTVLGLRRAKDNTYRLVTLHKSSAKKYAKVRKTKILGIEWL